jgi:hypothetical protein
MPETTYHDGLSHIVGKDDDTRARAGGHTAVKAICGYEYVPSRDPANFPLCPKCEAVAKRDRIDVSGKHR